MSEAKLDERPQPQGSSRMQAGALPGAYSAFKFWLGEKGHTIKFVRHLLGLDLDQTNKFDRQQMPGATSRRWTPSLHGLKLSHAFQGINFSTNFLFFLLFLGLFLWLFVIYWVRHHEPFANQVLGTPALSSSTMADRALVNGIKKTFPVRTSPNMGDIYVPGSEAQAQPVASDSPFANAVAPVMSNQAGYLPYGSPNNSGTLEASRGHHNLSLPTNATYMIGVQTGSGTKVKTVVSR